MVTPKPWIYLTDQSDIYYRNDHSINGVMYMIEANDPNVGEMLLYSKLTDEIMFFGNNAVIRVNVLLYRNDTRTGKVGGNGFYYYKENQFTNKNGIVTRSITRNIDVYLSIENLKKSHRESNMREYMVLRGRDIEMMRILLLPKLEYLVSYLNETFQYREGKLYLDENIKTIEVEIGNGDKALYFRPGVHKLFNDELTPCLEVYLNSPKNVSLMNIGNVYEFIYFIRNINIYQYAASMLAAYGNPPMGLNLYDNGLQQTMNMISDFQYDDPRKNRRGGFFNKEIDRRKKEEEEG